jgi:pyridoxine/pyridoxamine 5'-phosphate oxidase
MAGGVIPGYQASTNKEVHEMTRTYNGQWQQIADGYFSATNQHRATARQIAAWAISEGLWLPSPRLLLAKAAEDAAKALREQYITDPQGRQVRAKHAAGIVEDGVQQTFWADLRFASRDHLEIAFKQRRGQIVADCHQLKTDVDSYNENFNTGRPIQMSFDFTLDLVEIDAA